jgi:predicted lysophospholipase L1 biosynthesis ABC-type transport system permease subunit
VAGDLPFTSSNMYADVSLDGTAPAPGTRRPEIEFRTVSQDYFRVLGLARLAGVGPEAPAREGGLESVVINQRMVDQFWPGASPVGRAITLGSGANLRRATISGVIDNELDDGFGSQPEARIYRAFDASPDRSPSVLIKTSGAPGAVAPSVRRVISGFDPEIAVSAVRSLDELVGSTVAGRRAVLSLVMVFSAFALALAAVGIYGVMAFLVSERTHEIALRTALGATPAQVVQLVSRDALPMVAFGLALGTLLALAAGRLLSSFLFAISLEDPASYLATAALVTGVAMAATLVPARRALGVEPGLALRG